MILLRIMLRPAGLILHSFAASYQVVTVQRSLLCKGIIVEDQSFEAGELPYEDLFKDSEDCGPKVNEGVAKRVNSAKCFKRPTKEQFSTIQKKYLRPENCKFLKAPQMNPELWDDLLDRTKSREYSFQSFQKNLIKGITSVVQPASKVVDAKKRKVDSIPLNDVLRPIGRCSHLAGKFCV